MLVAGGSEHHICQDPPLLPEGGTAHHKGAKPYNQGKFAKSVNALNLSLCLSHKAAIRRLSKTREKSGYKENSEPYLHDHKLTEANKARIACKTTI